MQDTLLNLIPGACSPEVHLSQYDKGRVVPFKLADGKSAYDVPAGSTIVVKATKPSGLGFVVPVSFEGDTATMTISETMSNEYGRFPAELSITNGGTLIGTANFVLNVEKSPHPEGTTDGDAETLIPELTLLVNEIRESNAKVESMTASATSLPAGSTPTAEYDSENNDLAFGIPTSEVTKADLYKAFITKSANGSIASFSDGGDDLLMKSLKVNIVPKQSGSGDPSPSNVRAISGWSEVNTEVAGKNLFNPNLNSGLLGTDAGTNDTTVTPSNRYGYSEKIPATLSCKLSFKTNDLEKFNWICVMRYIDGIATERVYSTLINHQQKEQVNIPAVANSYIRVLVGANSGNTVGTTPSGEIQIELGSTMTDYEPYEGNTYPISLGQTVYGGTLDVVSGVLTVDMVTVDLGSLTWYINSTYNIFTAWLSPTPLPSTPTESGFAILPNYLYSPNFVLDSSKDKVCEIGRTGYFVNNLIIRDTSYADASAFKTAMSGKIGAYKTATPIAEIQLTPTEVKTLLGQNNIWVDSGSVEVEYRADTTLAYNELVAMILENIGG